MDRSTRLISPSLGELLDRLAIDQIKEVSDPVNKSSYSHEITKIEEDLDLFIAAKKMKFDVYIIRLVIALSQINLHIWRTKDVMQTIPDRFKESMKLAHQLNGIRNQIKNRITEETADGGESEKKTNLMTDELKGWDFSILAGRESLKSAQHSISSDSSEVSRDNPLNAKRQYEYLLTDLIDHLTIDQIKEVLLPEHQRSIYKKELLQLSSDVDLLIKMRKIKPTARLVRHIIFLAQANLHVWFNKDRMQQEPQKYYELLEFAQELNGLRNFVRNLLMEEFKEADASHQRATFLDYSDHKWYAPIIKSMDKARSTPVLTLTLNDFARLFATSIDDFPSDCLEIINKKDFRYQKLDMNSRDQILNRILKRIDSEEMWVSGPDKQDVWELGWSENLRDFQKDNNTSALTPKFVQSNSVLRLDRDYIQPLSPDFEFNFADVLRRWVFRKYLKSANSIYEFGCGSCQHMPVLAELFPEKPLHGLDWALASSKIIETLVKEKGWNITGHTFNLFSPDEKLKIDQKSAVFTFGTMEQLGRKFQPFLEFLLRKRPFIIMHVETMRELYDENYLTDYLAIRYDAKRNYLVGCLDALRQLEQDNKIEILKAHRIFFGSMYHDSYSLVVWRLK